MRRGKKVRGCVVDSIKTRCECIEASIQAIRYKGLRLTATRKICQVGKRGKIGKIGKIQCRQTTREKGPEKHTSRRHESRRHQRKEMQEVRAARQARDASDKRTLR
jgi:hypothetical protein